MGKALSAFFALGAVFFVVFFISNNKGMTGTYAPRIIGSPRITFHRNGTFVMQEAMYNSTNTGNYEVRGNTIRLHLNDPSTGKQPTYKSQEERWLAEGLQSALDCQLSQDKQSFAMMGLEFEKQR